MCANLSLYIFHSQIVNLIINSPIGSSICKNIKVFPRCYKLNRFPQIKRNGPLMSPQELSQQNSSLSKSLTTILGAYLFNGLTNFKETSYQ